MKYFGTDGIRGIYNKEINCNLAYKVGNALSKTKKNVTILIGRDTRKSGGSILEALINGVILGGGSVYDCGILPTPAVSYLTKISNADFGVVITASHNPKEYNGIKILDNNGIKLNEDEESEFEKLIDSELVKSEILGSVKKAYKLKKEYINYISGCCFKPLKNLKIVLDCANGATVKTAKQIFKKCGAKVVCIGCDYKNKEINDNCGCLFPNNLSKKVVKCGADCGFAFDGDGDRVIACDRYGEIIDGDEMLYALTLHYKKLGFKNFTVVGTSLTNLGVEIALKKKHINLIRTNVGDKYIIDELLKNNNCFLGGEQAGHIIIKHLLSSGDGVLVAVLLSSIIVDYKKTLKNVASVEKYSQYSENYITKNKSEIIKNANLLSLIEKLKKESLTKVRIVVRESGTEPKIRVMVESKSDIINSNIANRILDYIKFLDSSIKG